MKSKIIRDRGLILILIIFLIGCLLPILSYYLQFGKNGQSEDNTDWGTFGDYVGGVIGTIFSVLSAFLIYLTYKSQKEELSQNRKLITEQSSTLKQQSETLNRQQFDTTFFNLLNMQANIVQQMTITAYDEGAVGPTPTYKTKIGSDYFKTIYNRDFKTTFPKAESGNPPFLRIKEYDSDDPTLNIIRDVFLSVYGSQKHLLSHYFRSLYNIILFIDKSEVNNKYEYISILRSQLSAFEMLVLFYNGLGPYGEKFKVLIEKYHLLKGFPEEELLKKTHYGLYLETAYEKP